MATEKEPWRKMSDEEYYQALAAILDFGESERLPKVIKLTNITPRECQEIIYMQSTGRGATEEELVEWMHLDRETIDKDLKRLYEGGHCNPGRRGWRIIPGYGLWKDAIAPTWKFDHEREGLAGIKNTLWAEFEVKEWWPRLEDEMKRRWEAAGKVATSRIMPYWKAVDGVPGVEEFDDMRAILKKAENEEWGIAVGRCACRWIQGVVEVPLWACMNFGRFARYNLLRGAFRRVSYEEAMKVLDQAMDASLFQLQSPNAKVVERQICNCDMQGGCPLNAYKYYQVAVTHHMRSPSRFFPQVDPTKCKACGKCVEGCPFNAASMHYYEDIKKWRSWTDPEKCMGVGHCAVYCPNGARKMVCVRPPEHVPDWMPIRVAEPSRATE